LYKIKKYISVVLLGLFVFPILFQSIHIVWHHSHDILHTSNSLGCTNKVVCFNEDNHCPICEYQFFVNKQPNTDFFEIVIPFICNSFKETAIFQPYQQNFSLISPRAPPSFSFS
jgi:hypothetical protein